MTEDHSTAFSWDDACGLAKSRKLTSAAVFVHTGQRVDNRKIFHLQAKVLAGDVLQMMRFIDDETVITRSDW